MLATRDFDILTVNDTYGATLTLLDAADSKHWEPRAALPEQRLQALRIAHDHGIRTVASLEPVIDPEQTLEMIEWAHEFTDLYKVGKLNYHPHAATIDWHDFGHKAVELLDSLGAKYYIKNDLKKEMGLSEGPTPT